MHRLANELLLANMQPAALPEQTFVGLDDLVDEAHPATTRSRPDSDVPRRPLPAERDYPVGESIPAFTHMVTRSQFPASSGTGTAT